MGLLRRVFGPSKDEVWERLAAEIEGDFVKGGFLRGSKVEARAGEWTITLDTFTVSSGHSTVTYTRMRAPYVNRDGFRFKVYRGGIFSEIGKFFGMQDIEVGEDAFDRDFIVKSADESRVRMLLSNPHLRELIALQPEIHLAVKDDEGWFATRFPDGVDELYFSATGIIKDLDRLKRLFDLFAEVLDALVDLGAAESGPANVRF